MTTTCPVTGRIHRNARELREELVRLDSQIKLMSEIVASYERFRFPGAVPEAIGTAWNAAHDALDALERERASVEANPRPMRESDRETWRLVSENRD